MAWCMDERHAERWAGLVEADQTNAGDSERMCLFYLLSGADGLYQNRHAIYDFQNHSIRLEVLNGEKRLSSGHQALIRLGFNLYNGYCGKGTSPLELFWHLDCRNREVAYQAIRIRFGMLSEGGEGAEKGGD